MFGGIDNVRNRAVSEIDNPRMSPSIVRRYERIFRRMAYQGHDLIFSRNFPGIGPLGVDSHKKPQIAKTVVGFVSGAWSKLGSPFRASNHHQCFCRIERRNDAALRTQEVR